MHAFLLIIFLVSFLTFIILCQNYIIPDEFFYNNVCAVWRKKQIKLLLITMITLAFATEFLCDFTNEFIIIVFRINSPFTVLFFCFEALGYVEVVNCYLYNVEIISKISSNLLITLLFTCYDWIFWQMTVGFFISLYAV